jgi:hypothetical protein
MNALIDIAVTLALLMFLVFGAAVTVKVLIYAGWILSSVRWRGHVSAAAKQAGNAKSARSGGTGSFGGILIHHPQVRVTHGRSVTSK